MTEHDKTSNDRALPDTPDGVTGPPRAQSGETGVRGASPRSPSNRILILGEAPGARNAGGLTRRRLSDLAGRPWEEWADFRNLLDDYPGPGPGKGASWNLREAAKQAALLHERGDLAEYDRVILLGRRVAQAMIPAGAGFPLFRWVDIGAARLAVIPHTSGIVRWWNDPENVERAKAFVQETVKEVTNMAETTSQEQDLAQALIGAVKEAVGDGVTETEKKGYVRLNVGGKTLAYVSRPTKTGVRVEVPAPAGGYDKVKVSKKGEIAKAVKLAKARAEKVAVPA